MQAEVFIWECSLCEYSLLIDQKLTDPYIVTLVNATIEAHTQAHERDVVLGAQELLT